MLLTNKATCIIYWVASTKGLCASSLSLSHLSQHLWLLTQGRGDRNCQTFFPAATASRCASSASHVRWHHWPQWTRLHMREHLPPEQQVNKRSWGGCLAWTATCCGWRGWCGGCSPWCSFLSFQSQKPVPPPSPPPSAKQKTNRQQSRYRPQTHSEVSLWNNLHLINECAIFLNARIECWCMLLSNNAPLEFKLTWNIKLKTVNIYSSWCSTDHLHHVYFINSHLFVYK